MAQTGKGVTRSFARAHAAFVCLRCGEFVASYHLSVKTIKRSAGRSATAASAYRSASTVSCEREGRVHDYTAKQGVRESFILTPPDAPDWAQDRSALWNAAEARETRSNSVTAREWEVALPSEISDHARAEIVREFAQVLVDRYRVAVDVAIHAPHREGDQRNHHAHIMTTTRKLEATGLTDKTRVLDVAKTGGVEIEQMRGVWAELQNRALERAGEVERVDHRSLEVQRSAALSRGETQRAEELDRAPEVKLGPAANAIERRAMREAHAEQREYVPQTERGAVVHAARQARAAFAEMRERLGAVRDAYSAARDQGQDRVTAGLAALRAAAERQRGSVAEDEGRDSVKDRLAQIVGRGGSEREAGDGTGAERADRQGSRDIRDRLSEALGRVKPAAREEQERSAGDEQDVAKERDRDRGTGHGEGWGW